MSDLARLADLLKQRNAIDQDIAALIGRPAHKGHVGEYIAAAIFGIKLEETAVHKGSDGKFSDGPLQGYSVNIKWYGKHDGLLAVSLDGSPDYYLVLTGPKSGAMSSKGTHVPWIIVHAFLFDAHALVATLRASGKKHIGIATSVVKQHWQEAEIYPTPRNSKLVLSDEQRHLLGLFQEALTASEALSDVDSDS